MVPAAGPLAPYPSPLAFRLRRVHRDDFARIQGLSSLIPPALAQGIANGTASAALDAAEQGPQRFHEVLATAHARGYSAAMNAVSSALVATDADGRHGILVAEPAVKAFRQPGTFSGHSQLEILTLVFAAEITTITEPARSMMGAALLHAAADLYSRAGFAILYGTAPAQAEPFAPMPFRTTGAGMALCLDPAFLRQCVGLATVRPDPGTVIYYADLQGQAQADWEYPMAALERERPTEHSERPGVRTRRTPGLAFGS